MIRPLAEVFGEMRDPRKSAGKWHSMGTTLTLIFLGILSGEQGPRGIAGWIAEQRWRLGRQFKMKNCRVPSYGTVRRVLAAVDVQELEQRLGKWAQEAVQAYTGEDWPGIAIDGKTLRSSGDDAHPALHLLSAFSHELGLVLTQRAVGSKTNEIPEARRLLEDLTLEGKLVTVDALHTQRETAQAIVEKKGPI
jgi:DDE_Tnp_1-associated/Transposase DDE domain